jgi:hypothetical protein
MRDYIGSDIVEMVVGLFAPGAWGKRCSVGLDFMSVGISWFPGVPASLSGFGHPRLLMFRPRCGLSYCVIIDGQKFYGDWGMWGDLFYWAKDMAPLKRGLVIALCMVFCILRF